jgi:hypothetical protein
MENDQNYDQATLEYFRGDATLANEAQEMVNSGDVDNLVGVDNLNRFGDWSNDKNVVYVFNDRIRMAYEIVLNQGRYSEIVLGLEPESRPQQRKRAREPQQDVGGPYHPSIPARERFERGARIQGGVPTQAGDDG